MSIPAPPPAPTDPLREQLDELDALLLRMLELPVNPVDNDPGPLSTIEPLPPVPPVSDPWPPLSTPVELRTDEPLRPAANAEVPPTSRIEDRGSKIEDRTGKGDSRSSILHPRSSIFDPPSPILWPLLGVNRLFDRTVSRLGFVGRWLRGRWGRALLGLVGVLCLAGAAVLVLLDWIGWTW